MDKTYLTEVLNFLLSSVGFLFLVLLLKNTLQTLRREKWKFARLKKKMSLEILEKMRTPLFGILIIFTSFAIVNTILGSIQNLPIGLEETNPKTLTEAVQAYSYTGIFGVILFCLAGYFYILSGFQSWLKNIARFFIILAPFYILIQMLRYAIELG